MTGIRAGGIGSGLDINSLVSQLVAAERAPQSQRLNRLESGAKFKLSALARLSSSFDALRTATSTLQADTSFGRRSVSSSSQTHATATASARTPLGSYQLEVLSLASASKHVSAGVAGDQALVAGALSVTVGDVSFVVEVEDGHTPDDLRRVFNTAAEAAGARVQATLVNGDDGQVHFSVTGRDTGAANAVTISSDDPGLSAFTTDVMTALTTATDARVRIDGVERSSSSNVITGAVDGLSITVRQVSEEPSTLTVGQDNAPTRQAVQGFVTAYNAAINALREATRFDPATNTAGAFNGDALARSATADLRNTFASFVGDAAALGLSSQLDGTLKFDTAKFDAALAEAPARTEQALRGFGDTLGQTLKRYAGSDGAFGARKQGLDAQVKRATQQREALDRRMEQVEARLMRQFTALDSLIAQLNNTSSYLGQQIASLPGAYRGKD